MDNLPTLRQNQSLVSLSLPEFLTDKKDMELYQKLLYSVFEIWNEGQKIKSNKRVVLWQKLFININEFIFDHSNNSINFEHCLAAGALIFKINSNKIYVFARISYMEELFQLLKDKPSFSTIFKQLGNIANIDADQINITNQFQQFLNDFKDRFPSLLCNFGWSLYELKYSISDMIFFNAEFLDDINSRIIDSIIDDNSDAFIQLVSQNSNEKNGINQKFTFIKYKLPIVLCDNPPYFSLCCFFQSEKCFSEFIDFIPGGLTSEEISKIDDKGRTPMHFACAGQNIRIINQLYQAGFSINQEDFDGFTPCHYAAMSGTLTVFKFLFTKNANIFSANFFGFTPFHIACIYNNMQIIEFFIGNENCKDFLKNILQNEKSVSCLSLACKECNGNVVKSLLKVLYIFKNDIRNLNEIVLFSLCAACSNGSMICIKLILQSQIYLENSNYFDEKLYYLIEAAATNGYIDVIKFLCSRGITKSKCNFASSKTLFQKEAKNENKEKSSEEKKSNTIKYSKFKIDFFDELFFKLLSESEKTQIDEIINHFQEIPKLSNEDYYSFFDSLSKYNCEKGFLKSLQCCAISGIIPSFFKMKYKEKFGTIMAINNEKISYLLNKSKRAISASFMLSNCIELSFDNAYKMIYQGSNENKMFPYYHILTHLGYNFKFYFVIESTEEYGCFHVDSKEDSLNEIKDQQSIKLPNNVRFLDQWRLTNNLKKNISMQQKQLNSWKEFTRSFEDVLIMIKDIVNQDDFDMNLDENNRIDLNQLDDDKVLEYSFNLVHNLKSIILQGSLINSAEKNLFLKNILDKIYSSDIQKDKAEKIICDILDHHKNQSWGNSDALKFAFLMKFNSSSSYYKLFKFLNEKIPPPSTVDSHFRTKVIEREKELTCASDVTNLLNQYWDDVKNDVNEYLLKFNKKFSKDIDINHFKIKVSLGCDAASFTNFTQKKKVKNKSTKEKNEKDKSNLKNIIFTKLIKGDYETEDLPDISQFDNEIPSDKNSHYFFSMLLQPFSWKFPVSVIHLTKSPNGHFGKKEALDVFYLIKSINSHPHFTVNYFAADGETSLNSFHELAFNEYKDQIDKVINGEITFESFFEYVKTNCIILPVLDMFHAEKGGRNRIINNDINLGSSEDLIKLDILKNSLEMHGGVFEDKSTIGRMKDAYPIYLFQLKNSLKEFKEGHNASGFYIFIYSLILEIFRNPFIDLQIRSDLSKIALYTLFLLYNDSDELPENTGFRKYAQSNNKYVWFTEKNNIMKLINTVISIATILDDPMDSYMFGLERISSHPEEQFFGRYRMHFLGNYNPKNAFSFAVKTSLALDFENDLGITFSIPKRENHAGAHLDFNDSQEKTEIFKQEKDEFNLHDNIYNIASDLHQTGKGEKKELDECTKYFLTSLTEFFEINPSFKSKEVSSTKGSAIVPRLTANNNE